MRVYAAELADLYVEDARAAVLVGDTVIALSELATAVLTALLAAPDGLTVAELAVRLVAEFGDPGNATELTLTTVDDLAEHGVVRPG